MKRSGPPQRRTPLVARTGLSPGTGLQRGKSLAPVSKKRQAENRQRRAMVTELHPERPLCSVWQARLTIALPPLPRCTRWGDDAHEPLSRARGGSITDRENSTAPCRPCHDVLTFTPESELAWAYQLGLLVHSWGGAS